MSTGGKNHFIAVGGSLERLNCGELTRKRPVMYTPERNSRSLLIMPPVSKRGVVQPMNFPYIVDCKQYRQGVVQPSYENEKCNRNPYVVDVENKCNQEELQPSNVV